MRKRESGQSISKTALSEMERLVLNLLVAHGKTTKEIAAQTRKSPRTIDAYRDRLRWKLGAKTTADLACVAIERGMIRVENSHLGK